MCTHTVTGQNLTFVYTFPRIPSHSGCGGSSSGSCAYCPSGKYKTSAGSEGCSDCPSGYTTLPGATALSECCPAGTHARYNVSGLRIYRDHWSILNVVFNYTDGTFYATGTLLTQMYDDFEFNTNECLVKIQQIMDMDQTNGDGSGHKRSITLVTSSGRTLQTTQVAGGATNVRSDVLESPPGTCIIKAHIIGHWANALKDMEYAYPDCKCNRGYAGVDGGTCTACSPGTYKNSSGAGACASCPVGKFGATAGLTICLDCNTNATTLRGASTASSDCKCNEGYFLDIECTPCARGTYKSIVSNDDACTSCPVDTHTQFYFSPQASTASSACILAPKVTFSVLVDMTVAQATSGVKAMILTRLVTLLETTLIVVDWPDSRRHGIQRRLLALSVTATAVVADTNAAALAVTMTTPVANAFQMAAADAGLAIVAPSVSSTITLSDCHAHSARRSSGSLSHCTCNVGFTGPNGGMCTACVPGKFKTSTGTAVCKSCVAGTFATATAATSNLCQDCSVGKYSPSVGATNCLDCPADSSSPEKSDALADCLCNDPHYYMEGFICTPRGPMYQQEKILADFLISESTKRRFCIPPYFNSTLNLFIDGDSEVQPSSVGWWVRFDNKVWDDSAHTFRLGLTLLEGTTLKRSSLLMTRTTLHHGRLVSLPSARMVYEADVFNKGGAQITGEQFKIFSACSGAPGGPNGFITTDTVWPDEL